MQAKVEKLPDSKVKLIITVDKAEMETYEKHAYKHLANSVKISGFRPGKAPMAILKKEIGDARFQNEVVEVAIPESYYKAVVEQKIQAIAQPEVKVTKFVPGEMLEYEAEVAILPEIKLPDYKNIKVKIEPAKVKKEEVAEVIENFRKEKSILRDVDREAGEGDRVEIDFDGFIGGKPLQGGSSKSHPLVIGSKSFIPGFEEELIGLKKGETKEFDIKFPEAYHAKELAGKGAHFIVKMQQVQEVELPELNDDFAKQVGPFETAAKLEEAIKENLTQAKEEENKHKAEQELLEKIADKTKFELPKEMVDQEAEGLVKDTEMNFMRQGIPFEQYLESIKKTREDLQKELRGEAEKRVKIGLVLSQVSKEEGVLVTDAEIEAEVEGRIVGIENPEEFKKRYLTEENKKNIELQLFTRKTIAKLMEYATKQA